MTPPLVCDHGADGESRLATSVTAGGAGRIINGSTTSRKSKSKRSTPGRGRWTGEEHNIFLEGLKRYGQDWNAISKLVKTRTPVQTRTHHQKFDQQRKKGRKFPEEPYETVGGDTGVGGGGGGGGSGDDTFSASLTISVPSSSPPSPSPSPSLSVSSGATSAAADTPTASPSSGSAVGRVPRRAAAVVARGKRLSRPPSGLRGVGGTPRSTRASVARANRAAELEKANAAKAISSADTAAGGGGGAAAGAAGAAAATGSGGNVRRRDGDPIGGCGVGFEGGRAGKRLKTDHPAPAPAYGDSNPRRPLFSFSLSSSSSSASSSPPCDRGVVSPVVIASARYSNEAGLMKSAIRGVDKVITGGEAGGADVDVGLGGGGGGSSSSSASGGIAPVSSAREPVGAASSCGGRQPPRSISETFLAGLLAEGSAAQAPMDSVASPPHLLQQQQQRFISAVLFDDVSAAFGSNALDASTSSSTLSAESCEMPISRFGASSPSSSDYARGGYLTTSDSGSYGSDAGSFTSGGAANANFRGYTVGVDDGPAAPFAPSSCSSPFSHQSDCGGGGSVGGGGLLGEAWDFSGDVGGFNEGAGIFDGGFGAGVGGVFADGAGVAGMVTGLAAAAAAAQPPRGVAPGNGRQKEKSIVKMKHVQEQGGHRFYQQSDAARVPALTPAAPAVNSCLSSPSLSGNLASSARDDLQTLASSPALVAGSGSSSSSVGGSDTGSGSNPFNLVIDAGAAGSTAAASAGGGGGGGTVCCTPLAESWTGCLETPNGGGGLEAFKAWHEHDDESMEDEFDYLAVFAFQDHFGML